jgi:hypothetical protein
MDSCELEAWPEPCWRCPSKQNHNDKRVDEITKVNGRTMKSDQYLVATLVTTQPNLG